jgi:hypothetical protein
MVQTRQQLISISDEYNSLFSKNEFYPLQKAYTTPHFLVFSVRFPGKTISLYIGRGNQYQGFFLSDKMPPSYLRVQDRLLDYVRKYLVGSRLGKIQLDSKNQVFFFRFKNEHSDNSILFGYKERQLFFIKQASKELYVSWSGETIESENISLNVENFLPDRFIEQESSDIWTINDYLLDEAKKMGGRPIQKKKEKFLLRKIANISNDLRQSSVWPFIEGDLLQDRIDLTVDELNLYGIKINTLALPSSWAKRDFIFKKIKKLKKAEDILKTRLEESQHELEKVKEGHFEFEVTKDKVIQPLWITHTIKTKTENSAFNIKYFSINKITGALGLDSHGNDHIRSICSKEHYWFHLENYRGAHCIIKTEDFSQLTPRYLEAIASMLRDHSGLEINEIPMLFSQLKHVKGVKGARGQVIIKKPKYLSCVYINWKEIISIS